MRKHTLLSLVVWLIVAFCAMTGHLAMCSVDGILSVQGVRFRSRRPARMSI